jgi:DNA-binding MarR family transcriptional regulator
MTSPLFRTARAPLLAGGPSCWRASPWPAGPPAWPRSCSTPPWPPGRGSTPAEEKALDLLERSGPLTAGELARQTGLAPASVTGLINRLELKGFARRIQNPGDRRSILVEVDVERLYARVAPLFADWVRSLQELYAGYSDEQLEVILHFLTEAARRQQEATARITGDEDR